MRRTLLRIGAVFTTLATAFAMQAAVAPAAHAVPFCSEPAIFGSYALRACVTFDPNGSGVVVGYAHVSLKAGHSDCTIRGRMAKSGGSYSDPPWEFPCPRDIEISIVTPAIFDPALGYYGTFFSTFSIERNSDHHIGPKTTSPTLTAYHP